MIKELDLMVHVPERNFRDFKGDGVDKKILNEEARKIVDRLASDGIIPEDHRVNIDIEETKEIGSGVLVSVDNIHYLVTFNPPTKN